MPQPLLDNDILENLRKKGRWPIPSSADLYTELERRLQSPFPNVMSYELTLYQLAPHLCNKVKMSKVVYPEVCEIVDNATRKHFKQYQSACFEEYRNDRIFGLYELIKHQWWKSPMISISEYVNCFSECEAVLQLRRFGIAVESMLLHRSKLVFYFIVYMKLYKQKVRLPNEHVSFRRYWFGQKGRYPTDERRRQAIYYFAIISEALSNSHPPYGKEILYIPVD